MLVVSTDLNGHARRYILRRADERRGVSMPDIVQTAELLSDKVYEGICRARVLIGDNPALEIDDAGILRNPESAGQALVEAAAALSQAADMIRQGAWPGTSPGTHGATQASTHATDTSRQ
jgi:hypothetical protein